MVTVFKDKIDALEEELRAVFLRKIWKELTDLVQKISGKKSFLVRFQDRCEIHPGGRRDFLGGTQASPEPLGLTFRNASGTPPPVANGCDEEQLA